MLRPGLMLSKAPDNLKHGVADASLIAKGVFLKYLFFFVFFFTHKF